MSSHALKLTALHRSHLNATRNELPEAYRCVSIEVLNRVLVECIDVTMSARHAHWNVRGGQFLSRHALFKSVVDELDPQIDVVARRICALGGIARGTAGIVAGESSLKPYPVHTISDHEHLDALACRLGLLAGELRISNEECRDHGDPATLHVLTQTSVIVENLLWRVESHVVAPH